MEYYQSLNKHFHFVYISQYNSLGQRSKWKLHCKMNEVKKVYCLWDLKSNFYLLLDVHDALAFNNHINGLSCE